MARWLWLILLSVVLATVAVVVMQLLQSDQGGSAAGADSAGGMAADELSAPRWQPGVHWRTVDLPADATAAQLLGLPAERIAVVYLFTYAAPQALAFEQPLRAWSVRLPEDVAFARVAVPLDAVTRRLASNFYTLEAIGADALVHQRLFELVARDPRRVLIPRRAARELFPAGAREAFRTAFTSPAVTQQLEVADAVRRKWQVDAVPALLIDNRYLVELQTVGAGRALQVADHLLAEIRAGRGRSANLESSRQTP